MSIIRMPSGKGLLVQAMLVLAVLAAQGVEAQTALTALKPTSERRCTRFTTKDKQICVARYPYRGGFVLKTGLGGLASSDNPGGHVAYNLGGAYDKLTFVMGPYGGEYAGAEFEDLIGPNSNGDNSNVIVTVKGDGRTLLDEVVWNHDAPREVTLDVKGVKELRFDVMRGTTDLVVAHVYLWKAGQKPTPAPNPLKVAAGKATLVKDIWPHYIRSAGWVAAITDIKKDMGCHKAEKISINRVDYNTGLQFTFDQALAGKNTAWAYFWLQKRYAKLSFIIGPRDNQSTQASGWLTVKADGKIIYEKEVKQTDMAEQVVIDVSGVNQLAFLGEYANSDFLGSITFGVVNITAWPAGSTGLPQPGTVNGSQERLSKLPDVCALCSNIPPFSVRGVAAHNQTWFDGSSRHYTFSMGGERFWEGFILTTGSTFFDDNINSYVTFDLAGEFDYITFTAGCLTQHRVLDDDIIRVYADDKLILETTIHATWPNQRFELPLNRCRTLKFAKPGNGKKAAKQVYFGIADAVLYRGKVVPNDLFVHDKPECPETADLIDLCQRPYFHYVGRFLSTLTNFDFNDCFKNGSSQRQFFQMKDGSKIYKGIMLETNIPLGLEDISMSEALFMFLTSAGGAISSSNVSAFTGVTAGAGGLAGGMGVLSLVDNGGGQSSVAAFNPYREYESLTFTVANKSEYVDPFAEIVGGEHQAPPVKLDVFADQVKVAEIMLNDKMPPTTYTVPIYKCEQLMFWLECGDVRSGQYVIYDMTVTKKKLPQTPSSVPKAMTEAPTSHQPTSGQQAKSKEVQEAQSKPPKGKKEKKKKNDEPVVWQIEKLSNNKDMDNYLNAVTATWNATQEMLKQSASSYKMSETYVTAEDGTVYKAVSLLDSHGKKLSIQGVIHANKQVIEMERTVKLKATDADLYLPSATLAVPSLGDKMFTYSKYIKLGPKATSQCRNQAKETAEIKGMETDMLESMQKQAVTVDGVASTDKTLLLPLPSTAQPPEGTTLQQIRYFMMD